MIFLKTMMIKNFNLYIDNNSPLPEIYSDINSNSLLETSPDINSSSLLETSPDINSNSLLDTSPDINYYIETLYSLVNIDINIYMVLYIAGIALTVGILYMNIGRLDNPLAELSEMEKKQRKDSKRFTKLSDRICHQILVNKRRALNNQEPICYSGFTVEFGHLGSTEECTLVDIMRKIPSSHLRYTFPYHRLGNYAYNTYFLCKQTNERPCAD